MYIKEGGNVFKDADGAITTTRINQTDVKPTSKMARATHWPASNGQHAWYQQDKSQLQVI